MAALKKFIYYDEAGNVRAADWGAKPAGWDADKGPLLYIQQAYFTSNLDLTASLPYMGISDAVFDIVTDGNIDHQIIVNTAGDYVAINFSTIPKFLIPVKTTTGDPASPDEGQLYVNTFDNKVRCYAGGAWRDLATW